MKDLATDLTLRIFEGPLYMANVRATVAKRLRKVRNSILDDIARECSACCLDDEEDLERVLAVVKRHMVIA